MCKDSAPCNKSTGKCDDGCSLHWTGTYCEGIWKISASYFRRTQIVFERSLREIYVPRTYLSPIQTLNCIPITVLAESGF